MLRKSSGVARAFVFATSVSFVEVQQKKQCIKATTSKCDLVVPISTRSTERLVHRIRRRKVCRHCGCRCLSEPKELKAELLRQKTVVCCRRSSRTSSWHNSSSLTIAPVQPRLPDSLFISSSVTSICRVTANICLTLPSMPALRSSRSSNDSCWP